MPNNRIIIAAGAACSGKTTILKALHQHHPELKIVDYGQAMLREAARHQITRDELRHLPIEEQMFYSEAAARRIAEHARGTVIIDTHMLVKTAAGYFPGLPRDVVDELLPFAIVLIQADPELIEKRREQDKDFRKREIESTQDIALHQQANLACAASLCVLTGAVLKIITNNDDKTPDQAARELEPLLKGNLLPK